MRLFSFSLDRDKIATNARNILRENSAAKKQQRKIVFDLDELLSKDNKNNLNENFAANNDLEMIKRKNSNSSSQQQQQHNSSSSNNNDLQFESRFESGNLRRALKIDDFEYDLILCPDVNTDKHFQWFYFQVSNTNKDAAYTFNVVNYEKANSQFNFGMQPLMFSVKEAVSGRPFWTRVGKDIIYFKNHFAKSIKEGDNHLTASFAFKFPHDNDICYFAYHFPYTYTTLMVRNQA